MEDDPFFAPISNPSEIKPVTATVSFNDDKHKSSKPNKSDSKTKKSDSKNNNRQKQSRDSHRDSHASSKKSDHKDHDKLEKSGIPTSYKRKKYIDPRIRLPSMLNDIPFPKPLSINPDAPPNSFKIFNPEVPEIPKLAELYD